MIVFIIKYWRDFIIGFAAIALLWLGHEATIGWQAISEVSSLKADLAKANTVGPAIVEFNEKLSKVKANDPCYNNSSIPPAYLKLRRP